MEFHFQDCPKPLQEKYQLLKKSLIGTGSYGVVHKIINKKTKKIYALKIIQKTSSGFEFNELSILVKLIFRNY